MTATTPTTYIRRRHDEGRWRGSSRSGEVDADEVDLRALQVSLRKPRTFPGGSIYLMCLREQNGSYKIIMLGTFLSFYSF